MHTPIRLITLGCLKRFILILSDMMLLTSSRPKYPEIRPWLVDSWSYNIALHIVIDTLYFTIVFQLLSLELGDDTYLSMFSQPLSEAWDSTIIQVAFGATNGPCTQSQTLLMRKEMALMWTRHNEHLWMLSMQDRKCHVNLPCPRVSSSLILLLGINIFPVSSLTCPDFTRVSLCSLNWGSSAACHGSTRLRSFICYNMYCMCHCRLENFAVKKIISWLISNAKI